MRKLERLIVETFHKSLHDTLLSWARDRRKGSVDSKLKVLEWSPLTALAEAYFAPQVLTELRHVHPSCLRVRFGTEWGEPIIFAASEEEKKNGKWRWLFAAAA